MKKTFKKFRIGASIGMVLLIVMVLLQLAQFAQAAALTSMSDTMTRLKVNETANHTVKWTLPTGVTFAAGDKARVDFPDAFVTLNSGWATTDFTFNDGAPRTIIGVAIDADPTCTPGANNIGVRINNATDQFEIWACTDYTPSGTAATVTFTIAGTSPNGTLTNPPTLGSYKVDLVGDNKGDAFDGNDDIGSFAVYIITDDQVIVSATVDPSITFVLSSNTRDLGTLSQGAVANTSMTVQTITNALGGYSTTVLENQDLCIGASPCIGDAAGGSVVAGENEYGLATSQSGNDFPQDTSCGAGPYDAGPIISTAKKVAGVGSGPTDQTVTLCFAASTDGARTAGSYSHTLTFVSTATF